MSENFGRFEQAANDLLRYAIKSLRVPNWDSIILNVQLGDEFEKALGHVRGDQRLEQLLTAHTRLICKELGLSCGKFNMYSSRWGGPYRKFVSHIKVNAAKERKKRLG